MRRVGRLQNILRRYVRRLHGSPDHRESRCEQKLLQRKLHMGDNIEAAIKQKKQSKNYLSKRRNSLGRIMPSIRVQQDNVNHEIESGNDCRRSGERCDEFTLWEKYKPKEQIKTKCKKEHVYDLVNCGPRHRFLIKNDAEEVFVSHNSMGHGVDGLQDSGHIVVWFGINWSLELYDQMCGRIDRQGQSQPVSIIRILCNDTVDLAVADAIERKTDDQEGLKAAMQRYRDGVTTNELDVNFF